MESNYSAWANLSESYRFTYDIDAKTVDLTPELCERFDGMESHFDNMPDSFAEKYVYEEDRDCFCSMYSAVNSGNEYVTGDFRTVNPDRWCRVSFVRTGKDSPLVTAFVQDVTKDYNEIIGSVREKDRVMEAYYEASRDTKLLVNGMCNVYDLVLLVNLTKNTYHRIDESNFTLEGVGREGVFDDLVDSAVANVTEEFREPFRTRYSRQALLERYKSGCTYVEYEYKRYKEDGTIGWVDTHILFSVDSVSGDLMQISMTKDADERHDIEARQTQLLKDAYDEANRANKAKTDFLSRMSHDVRTPINGIVGLVHILENGLDDREKTVEGLEQIKTLSKQLELLINEVLQMSRIERGKTELTHEKFSLADCVEELAPAIRIMAEEKGVTITKAEFHCEHKVVVSSPVHIQRIVMNILTNAIRYNRIGGTVECAISEISMDQYHSNFELVIKDTGIGMSKAFLKEVYSPFAMEKQKADSSQSGTGLGMAITKELVDLFGGTIDIQSELNVGTTVTVRLPLEITNEKEIESTISVEEISLEGHKILLVEDNKINMKIARYLLEERLALVEEAWDGQEAVEKFSASEPSEYDLILMDIRMPVMDGLQATEAIRKLDREDAKTIPIIAMTANAYEEDVRACKQAGMNEHIGKPIDVEKLLPTINKYLEKSVVRTTKIGKMMNIKDYVVFGLDRAIEKKSIEVYLQPIHRTITGELCEFEALARWNDETRGFLCPADFIPALEEAKLLYKLDAYMMNEICAIQRERIDCGENVVPISMNFSRTDFIMCDMVEVVKKAVDSHQIPKDLIRIEITESALLKDTEVILSVVERFRDLGFQVWMDDFGEGYSSLNMLASCDFDLLKLDMGFMRHFNLKTKNVIENIIRMSKQLGMRTLAEGVETEEQFEFLRQIGCEKIQGYYLGKPMKVADVLPHVENKHYKVEEETYRRYYDQIGGVEYITDKPLTIYEMAEDQLTMLYFNDAFSREMMNMGMASPDRFIRVVNEKSTDLPVHFRQFLDGIQDMNRSYQFDFTAGNYYMRLQVQKIAETDNRKAFATETTNLTNYRGAYHTLYSKQPDGAYYEFTEDCRVGVPEIDAEHMHFFDMCNHAVAAVNHSDIVDETAKGIIREIKDYAHTHFAHEEAYMEKIHDPLLERQRIEHQQFIEKADGINENLMTKDEYMDTVNFIVQWLYKHIIGSDTKIGKN